MSRYAEPGLGQGPFGGGGDEYGGGGWSPEHGPERVSGLAIASLVSSLLCVTGLAGVGFGLLALWRISAERGRLSGRGLAFTGIVLGLISTSVIGGTLLGFRKAAAEALATFYLPTTAFFEAVDRGDADAVRAAFDASARERVTGEEIERFAGEVRGALGRAVGAIASLDDAMVAGRLGAAARSGIFGADVGGGTMKFERTPALVFFRAVPGGVSAPGTLSGVSAFPGGRLVSLGVLLADGRRFELPAPTPTSTPTSTPAPSSGGAGPAGEGKGGGGGGGSGGEEAAR
ncbi:MAG: DUF4190 domain-containing protein [Phycisphaeraceae bacterium]|nr:MAG: DUF4190 domain-containing protein [Phycisphaeraceae bacterium]